MSVITYPTIQQNACGEIVVQLQSFLSEAGSSVKIDGIFGFGTRSAVRAFQKRHGITPTGIVEPKTWSKLLEVSGNIKFTEPNQKKADKPLITLIIQDLSESEAEALLKKYPNAQKIFG